MPLPPSLARVRRYRQPLFPSFTDSKKPSRLAHSLKTPRTADGRIAQLVEQLTLNQRVLGSSPSASTIFSQYIKCLSHFSDVAFGRLPALGSFLGSRQNFRTS